MSVYIPIPIAEVVQEREPPSRTYRLDLTRGRIYGYVDGLDAVNQFIRKTLITPRFRCLIYDNQYGSEIKQTVVADDATPELIESELPRIVKDALLADSRILDVYDFSFAFDGDRCAIKFGASTVFGETVVEEVM